MSPIHADFFDGKSARRRQVSIVVSDGVVRVSGEELAFECPLAAVKISARMGKLPRRIEFPDGAVAVMQDNDGVDEAFAVTRQTTLALRLESHPVFVLAALVLTIALCWSGYQYGVPWAAREIAMRLPANLEADLAEESLKALDKYAFKPSELDAQRRQELTQLFTGVRSAAGQPDRVRLEFRDGDWIGANALALPGGIVVITDQLEDLMDDDDQIAAVLAHELGHIQHRHSLRHVLQNSITGLLAMAVYGDVSAIAGIAATVPTTLVHTHYSQGFEREADNYAYGLLKNTGRSPRALGQALQALEEGRADKDNDQAGKDRKRHSRDFGYLSTHPATAERIKAAEAAAR